MENLGVAFAILGAAFAAMFAGMGSAKGVGTVGKSAAGVITEDPGKFGRVLILEILPGTQGLYGFLAAFMIMNNITVGMPLSQGLGLFAASLPIAFAGLVSAIHQGRAAAAGCGLVAKRPEGLGDHPCRHGRNLRRSCSPYLHPSHRQSCLMILKVKKQEGRKWQG